MSAKFGYTKMSNHC